MSRRLPRSFFWIDQNLIRSGIWLKLSAEGRLAYIALAASCDREGVSIWSAPKLMELSACSEREEWGTRIAELENQGLIERIPDTAPPAIRLREFETPAPRPESDTFRPVSAPRALSTAPIVVQTTIHLGGSTGLC
jgi:hypothetical protein